MKNLPQTRLSDNDVAILNFLWRWKLATTSAIAKRFYSQSTRGAAYQRLWKLERAGFIRSRYDETATHCTWVLGQRGFAVIKERIPPLNEAGYLPNHWGHDLLVSAIHLGDGIFGDIAHLEMFTEQELRRLDSEFFPDWTPKSTRHRPDGYWRVTSPTGPKTIMLEVELTQKRDSDYQSLGRSLEYRAVDLVLWVVPRASLARAIQKQIEEGRARAEAHNYILLDAICEKGWQAPVILGSESGKSMGEVLEKGPRTPQEEPFACFSLDTRKRAEISKTPQIFRQS